MIQGQTCDETQRHHNGILATESDESDTESVQLQSDRRRRLRLTWNSEQEDVPPQIVVQGDPPDSHDERVARVRQTMRQERRERQFQVADQFIISVVDRVAQRGASHACFVDSIGQC